MAAEPQAAAEAQRRGAIAVTVAALKRAAKLSDDPARRGGRLLQATELAFKLGRRDLAGTTKQAATRERGRLCWSVRTWGGGPGGAAG